jgi:hypothetical protein
MAAATHSPPPPPCGAARTIMLKPLLPNFLRSIRTAWKWHRPKRIARILPSISLMYSGEKEQKARFRLAFRPCGGSLVSLMDRFRMPMGIPGDGSDVRKMRKRSWLPSCA